MLGTRLKLILTEKKISQAEFARQIGVGRYLVTKTLIV